MTEISADEMYARERSHMGEQIRDFLAADAFNVALASDQATREDLLDRGNELAKALRDAADHIDMLTVQADV